MSKKSKGAGSQDIRSFFQPKSSATSPKVNEATFTSRKRAKAIVSSDEDIIPESPVVKKQEKVYKKRKANIVSSDSEGESFVPGKKVKEKKTELKPVSALDVFGTGPVKQAKIPNIPKVEKSVDDKDNKKRKHDQHSSTDKTSDVKKIKKNSKPKEVATEFGFQDDPDFEKTLLELDETILLENVKGLDKTIDEALSKGGSVQISNESFLNTSNKKHEANKKVEVYDKKLEQDKISPIKGNTSSSNHGKTPKEKAPKEKPPVEFDNDLAQEKYEKKRHSAILYQKYLNRSGPAHRGSKEIPKGKPDCLNNLCFIRTGVLDSLDDNEFQEVIKSHGGRVVHSVSKKVNYVVVGEDPGPAKLEKAQSYDIKIISEDELLDLIRTKSGIKPIHDKTQNLPKEKSSEIPTETIIKVSKSKEASSTKVKSSEIPTETIIKVSKSKETSSTKVKSDSKSNKKEIQPQKEISKTKTPSKPLSKSVEPLKKNRSEKSKIEIPSNNMSWTEKYKPINTKGIIGQQEDKSNMKRLKAWLENWYKNHSGKNKPKLTRPSPWAKNDDGGYFKAALLSGPPGVGKTTTASLVAKELGFDIVEFNASDTRSKKLLHEEVSRLLNSKSLAGFFSDGSEPTSKHVLLMDEVDGMAGNEDRGGMQELIALIKNTKIPIICMCNDRNHQKIRSLANYCLDLRFSRPKLEQIRGAMMTVCFKEGIQIKPNALTEVINGAGMDIRQILTHLSIWSAEGKSLSTETATKEAKASQKDTPLGHWEVCQKVFSAKEHETMSLADRTRLFYHDYSMAPLFVHENYLGVVPKAPTKDHLKLFALAADAISMGDLVDTKIRRTNNWSLLDVEAMCASVLPGYYVEGRFNRQINFPGWLGKNSRKNKFNRLLSELQAHMRTSISGSKSAVNLDYVNHLRDKISLPLVKKGVQGIPEALDVMHTYNLVREDLDNIVELSQWPKGENPMSFIDSKVKAAFTRAYNKDSAMLPYAIETTATKKRSTVTSETEEYELEGEDEAVSDNSDNEDVTKDAMVKAKKAPSKKVSKSSDSEASSSKRGTSKTNAKKGKK